MRSSVISVINFTSLIDTDWLQNSLNVRLFMNVANFKATLIADLSSHSNLESVQLQEIVLVDYWLVHFSSYVTREECYCFQRHVKSPQTTKRSDWNEPINSKPPKRAKRAKERNEITGQNKRNLLKNSKANHKHRLSWSLFIVIYLNAFQANRSGILYFRSAMCLHFC